MNHKIKRTLSAVIFVALLITVPRAQQPAATTQQSSDDRIALYQALLDLTNPWTVMCVAAHPDDEDGTSLIVMRRKYGAHTVSLFSTFGEGGQNAIGPELYEELGAIRVRETMAAAEIQGSEPHFLGLKDFGYSKSADETFQKWGHDEALRRMVLQIRKLRPDVIITNHSVTSNDHGHHQATARLVVEAFEAAADANKFPEQLKDGVTVWQVQRLFVRARGNNQAQANAAPVVIIDPNERDPMRGTVYAEEALLALQKHDTQGPWPRTFAEFAARFRAFSGQSAAVGQLPLIRYALMREAKGAATLPKDSHNFLDALQTSDPDIALPNLHDSAMELSRTRPQALEQLSKAFRQRNYGGPNRSADPQRSVMMREKIERALALAAGIDLKVQPATTVAVPDSTVDMSIRITNSGSQPVNGINCKSGTGSLAERQTGEFAGLTIIVGPVNDRVAPGGSVAISNNVRIAADTPINVPVAEHLYEPSGLGLELNTRCTLEVSGARFAIDLPNRVDVVPTVEIARVTPSLMPLSPERANERAPRVQIPFEVTLINHQSVPFNGHLAAHDGTFGNPINDMVVKLAAGEKRTVKFTVAGPVSHIRHNSITFLVRDAKQSFPQRTVPIFSTEAHVRPDIHVGYIRGFDFSLPNALNALGVESKELSVGEVKTADLSKYTSFIVDNRVYESQPQLIATNQKLLDYANAGGNLIVFYHKSDEWNPDPRRNRPQLAPYKLILGNERITDENAPITFIEPDHPLLKLPNKIGPDDFKDWIQERGLYYPREWDPQFHALLQSNDPGETPLRGGLLVADYGKGHYLYTSMVWYRQLRAGVPGAYRMLANMISYGHAK